MTSTRPGRADMLLTTVVGEEVSLLDEELVDMGVSVSTVSSIFDGVLAFLKRLHVADAMSAFFAAYPEISKDVAELMAAVKALEEKIEHL